MTANNVSRHHQMSPRLGWGGCQNHPQLRTIDLRLQAPLHVEGVKINLESSPGWPDSFSVSLSFFESGIRKEVIKYFIHSLTHLPLRFLGQHRLTDSSGNTHTCPGLKLWRMLMIVKQIPSRMWPELPTLTRTLEFLPWPSHYFLMQSLLSRTQFHHLQNGLDVCFLSISPLEASFNIFLL